MTENANSVQTPAPVPAASNAAPPNSSSSSTAPAAAKPTAPQPAVSVGRIVLVRESGHPDSPCIVTAVADGKVSGNVFRGTHLPHTAVNLAEIDLANATAQGWFWPPRN